MYRISFWLWYYEKTFCTVELFMVWTASHRISFEFWILNRILYSIVQKNWQKMFLNFAISSCIYKYTHIYIYYIVGVACRPHDVLNAKCVFSRYNIIFIEDAYVRNLPCLFTLFSPRLMPRDNNCIAIKINEFAKTRMV